MNGGLIPESLRLRIEARTLIEQGAALTAAGAARLERAAELEAQAVEERIAARDLAETRRVAGTDDVVLKEWEERA